MIAHAEIIERPLSGEYEEKIYDIESSWKSSSWTWMKFTNNDGSEWVGSFRGEAIDVAISGKHKIILVLTTDYLFQLDVLSANLIKYDDHENYYKGLTISSLQDFILFDYNSLCKIENDIAEKIELKIPISISLVDYVKLRKWEENKLEFTCEEPTSEYCYLCSMEYDCITDSITLLGKKIMK